MFFGNLNGLLMVYLPGVHIQLFDCGIDHSPWNSLNFVGPAEVPNLPHYHFNNENSDESKTDIGEIFTVIEAPYLRNSASNGYMFLNVRNGCIYEYQFSYEFLKKWFLVQQCPYVIVQVLHLAIVHIKNEQLTTQVLMLYNLFNAFRLWKDCAQNWSSMQRLKRSLNIYLQNLLWRLKTRD